MVPKASDIRSTSQRAHAPQNTEMTDSLVSDPLPNTAVSRKGWRGIGATSREGWTIFQHNQHTVSTDDSLRWTATETQTALQERLTASEEPR